MLYDKSFELSAEHVRIVVRHVGSTFQSRSKKPTFFDRTSRSMTLRRPHIAIVINPRKPKYRKRRRLQRVFKDIQLTIKGKTNE
jgi:hypothetical protein